VKQGWKEQLGTSRGGVDERDHPTLAVIDRRELVFCAMLLTTTSMRSHCKDRSDPSANKETEEDESICQELQCLEMTRCTASQQHSSAASFDHQSHHKNLKFPTRSPRYLVSQLS
jgi:hypothetical protein